MLWEITYCPHYSHSSPTNNNTINNGDLCPHLQIPPHNITEICVRIHTVSPRSIDLTDFLGALGLVLGAY